ncbi:MAG: hypothetical protein M1826_005376 [Phylliscum demangeonii]|nr:MAG: hypothetical protein M1826_005376 [Phylliscum demangeonii]
MHDFPHHHHRNPHPDLSHAAGTVAGTTIFGLEVGPWVSAQVAELKEHWRGEGGRLYRQVRGRWSSWDKEQCYLRKYHQFEELYPDGIPDSATLRDWRHICSSRKTAELDEKEPRTGQPEYVDAEGRVIPNPNPNPNPNPSASAERPVDGEGGGAPNSNLKFANQVGKTSKRLWRGFPAWEERATALEKGAAGVFWKYAHDSDRSPIDDDVSYRSSPPGLDGNTRRRRWVIGLD